MLEAVLPVEAVPLKYELICSTVCYCGLGGGARAVLGEQVKEAGGDGVEEKGQDRDNIEGGFV